MAVVNKDEIIKSMEAFRPPFLDFFDVKITEIDPNIGMCKMDCHFSKSYCHSGNIVQGGFITMILDSVSSHAVFTKGPQIANVATLELKVSYFAPSYNGDYKAIGRIERMTRNFAFVSADLYNDEDERTASLTATAKIIYRK